MNYRKLKISGKKYGSLLYECCIGTTVMERVITKRVVGNFLKELKIVIIDVCKTLTTNFPSHQIVLTVWSEGGLISKKYFLNSYLKVVIKGKLDPKTGMI